jgi:hypothetical protein
MTQELKLNNVDSQKWQKPDQAGQAGQTRFQGRFDRGAL